MPRSRESIQECWFPNPAEPPASPKAAATDTYTVTLTRAPSADVTINITTDSQVSVSPTSLTFTTGNWATPQTVTVTAVNDTVDESNHSGLISHGLSSSDLSFGGLPIDGVTAAVIDNDANSAPVLAAIPPQTVNEGALLTFTASATDDGLPANTLTYSLIGAPVGASINPGTGVFTWTPAENQGPGQFQLHRPRERWKSNPRSAGLRHRGKPASKS